MSEVELLNTLEQDRRNQAPVSLRPTASLDAEDVTASRTLSGDFDYPLNLNCVPDGRWAKTFRRVYSELDAEKAPRAYLVGSPTVVTMTREDDKQKAIDIVKESIKEANNRCEGMRREATASAANDEESRVAVKATLHRLRGEAKEIRL